LKGATRFGFGNIVVSGYALPVRALVENVFANFIYALIAYLIAWLWYLLTKKKSIYHVVGGVTEGVCNLLCIQKKI
jgi:hypothetical protein